MQFEIKNRWSGAVQFTAEIECADNTPYSMRVGLAVRWALVNKISLSSADLSSANLRYANLSSANLSSANLRYANLRPADLSSADLSAANLSYADLRSADLRSANLSYADLRSANLSAANLSSADLRSANLSSANLNSADLSSADLRSANLSAARNAELIFARTSITPEGDLIGWKKLASGTLCKLRIPSEAKRSNATGRKCRAEYAVVLEGEGVSKYDDRFVYKIGETVHPREPFDENRWDECASGIHFFLTKIEAENYQ